MLTNLTVSNFAIIDNICIDFDNHLSVLTGETGAGKSLIIDAIGLLLGGRASSQMIRKGATKAIIEGVFTDYNPAINNILEDIGIDPLDDDTLIVKRDINENGKSISRINGSIVTLNQLEEISGLLADIHTQLDTKKLFDVRNYVDFLDNDESISLLKVYQSLRNDYLECLKQYNNIVNDANSSLENLDFYKYRLNEINSLHLDPNEIKNLEQELNVLNNYETIYNNYANLKEIFDKQNIVNGLYEAKNYLQKLVEFDESNQQLLTVLENSYYDLEDLEMTISSKLHGLEFDSNRLNEINDRLSTLNDIQRKYKMDIPSLIEYAKELEAKISNFEQSDLLVEEAQKKLDNAYNILVKQANMLTAKRQENAQILKANIMQTLKDLCLDKVRMEISFNNTDLAKNSNSFKANGVDDVDFLISFNIGEELKPLSKVASGGEMSRVMLAFKTHLLTNAKLSTIIFDEIDTGISGEVAASVAAKLKTISKTTQVLSITHLPIVAAAADQHLFVSKEVIDGRTSTKITKLNKEERIVELSKMISSNKDDISSQLVAENMINKYK